MRDICCKFCGGTLSEIEYQKHKNPGFRQYRVCLKCGYQWAKAKWPLLRKELPGIIKEFNLPTKCFTCGKKVFHGNLCFECTENGIHHDAGLEAKNVQIRSEM